MNEQHLPLAVRLRPTCLGEVIGETHLKKPHHALQKMIRSRRMSSLILYGPPLHTVGRIICGTDMPAVRSRGAAMRHFRRNGKCGSI